LLLVIAAIAGAGWWTLCTEAGSTWLLTRVTMLVPMVEVREPHGALLGDFGARQVRVKLSDDGSRVVIDALSWRGAKLRPGDAAGLWVHLGFAELRASRVDVLLEPSKTPTASKPPVDIGLPLQLDVDALQLDALHVSSLGDEPLRELRARLQLGAAGGAQHRVEGLQVVWQQLQAHASGHIDTRGAMALQSQIDLAHTPGPAPADTPEAAAASAPPSADAVQHIDLTEWQASLKLDGPLAAPELRAELRQPATNTHAASSLDAQAQLRPFADWPLAGLQLNAREFDLSRLLRQAPVTSLNLDATLQGNALDQPITASIDLSNGAAGRWSEGRVPLRSLKATLLSRSDDRSTLELQHFTAELGDRDQPAGVVEGQGVWNALRASLDLTLDAVQPAKIDERAPSLRIDGPLSLVLHKPLAAPAEALSSPQGAAPADATTSPPMQVDVKLNLRGELLSTSTKAKSKPGATPQVLQLQLDASVSALNIELREARAHSNGASASVSGTAQRSSEAEPWQAKGRGELVDFDPLPWWPGPEASAWRRGPHRLNADMAFDLQLPVDVAANPSAVRGHAQLNVKRSVLANTPIEASVTLQSTDDNRVGVRADVNLAGNRVRAEGRLATDTQTPGGHDDHWDLSLDAPVLEAVSPLWRLLKPAAAQGSAAAALSGALHASARVDGRWPAMTLQGELDASDLHLDAMALQRAQARWRLGTTEAAEIDIEASVSHLTQLPSAAPATPTKGKTARAAAAPPAPAPSPSIEAATLRITGTAAEHRIELRAGSKVQPPAWTETLQPDIAAQPGTALQLLARGGLFTHEGQPLAGWRGSVQRLELGGAGAANGTSAAGGLPAWLVLRDVDVQARWAGGPTQLTVQPGQAILLGSTVHWSELSWVDGSPGGKPPQIDVQMTIAPLPIAPVLHRLQPKFGWGGDLAMGGHINVHSDGHLMADIVLERSEGDLTVSDEVSSQALGLSYLRLAVNAREGVWTFSPYVNGSALGVVAGAVVARTDAEDLWPRPEAGIEGAMELDVANLGAWGAWVPTGWRLGGQLKASALFAGQFGAPAVNGQVTGHSLSVRNFVEGVNVSGGEVALSLNGERAVIETFTARAGTGTLAVEGGAQFGERPTAQLQLKADHFTVLGRLDRRIVASGQALLNLGGDSSSLKGAFTIDEGLIDFTHSDAPALSDDVVVVRAEAKKVKATKTEPGHDATDPDAPSVPAKVIALDVALDLGKKLQLRGRGLTTRLNGLLAITAPGGRLAVNGEVKLVRGKFSAYGQQLDIDPGSITFVGPPENPRLSIEAVRPNTDVRVGVRVSGTAMSPRVRLFSEPELPEVDKLSWLVMGRASDGLGRSDTALLQAAAMALISGQGDGQAMQLVKAVGLDELNVSQSTGEVQDTVFSLGKNLSRHWYVGYERGLNATGGNWQLIYRVARSFNLRAQSGEDNSVDAIWNWRWN
jgi:translocation and assembly module TamB